MAVPSKLKNMTLFNDGEDYKGLVSEVTLPTLARKVEGYRGGGHDTELPIDMGSEPIEFEWKVGGMVDHIYGQFAVTSLDGVQLRFVGSYQEDRTGLYKTVEIVVRGRHQEIAPGTGKPGEDTEQSIKTLCVYYKLTVDGRVLVEKDEMNLIHIVNGVDRLAEQRAALGY